MEVTEQGGDASAAMAAVAGAAAEEGKSSAPAGSNAKKGAEKERVGGAGAAGKDKKGERGRGAAEKSRAAGGGNGGNQGRKKPPVFLFFTVHQSGQFCGVAQMLGANDNGSKKVNSHKGRFEDISFWSGLTL